MNVLYNCNLKILGTCFVLEKIKTLHCRMEPREIFVRVCLYIHMIVKLFTRIAV